MRRTGGQAGRQVGRQAGRQSKKEGEDSYLKERSIDSFQAVSSARIHTHIQLGNGIQISNGIWELSLKQ